MKIVVKKNKLMFFGLFAINLIIGLFSSFILPERFFNDTIIIVFDKYHEIGWIGSYPFAIMFYKLTGLKYLPFPVISLIQYPIAIAILYKIGVPSNFDKINIKNLLVYVALFLTSLYLSMPTKEFITFIYVSMIPILYQSNKTPRFKIISSLLLIFCFGFFRQYYLIIPILAVGMYLVTFINFKNKALSTVFYGLVLTIFLSFSSGVVKGEFLSQSSREVYTDKFKQDVNSIIIAPMSQDTWYGESVGIVYGFLAVNVPIIELIKHLLSPQIVLFIIWQLLVFYILLVRFSNCLKDKKNRKFELWTLLILFSYFMVQGIFEPDLGTSIRHKMGFLPLIYYVLYYDHFRKKI